MKQFIATLRISGRQDQVFVFASKSERQTWLDNMIHTNSVPQESEIWFDVRD